MDACLRPIAAALAKLHDHELHGLVEMTITAPQVTGSLFAWVEHIAHWEINRRNGLHLPLPPSEADIPPGQDEKSLAAAAVMRDLAADHLGATDPRLLLFDAIKDALTGRARLQ